MAVTYPLNRRQAALYHLRATFYRTEGPKLISGGKIRDPHPTLTVLYADVPCYRKSTRDTSQITSVGRGTQDIMDTADELHIPLSYLVDDVVTPLQLTGNLRLQLTDATNGDANPDNEIWYVTVGQANPKPWRANKQILLIRYDVPNPHLP